MKLQIVAFAHSGVHVHPPPPSYHLARIFALFGAIILLIYSINLQTNGRKVRGFGIFTGLIISTLVFLLATLVGFWGFH